MAGPLGTAAKPWLVDQVRTPHQAHHPFGDALRAEGFTSLALESQEAFFIRHAGDVIAPTITAEAARLSQRKLALMQLLHPSHLGQKFQALHAVR